MNRRDERQQWPNEAKRRRKTEREREREREMGKLHLAAGEMQRRRMRLVDGGKHRRS
jgi:hypothetical protein